MRTVYLFGAGFSKDVADGPLMSELWGWMKRAYEARPWKPQERSGLGAEDTYRENAFEHAEATIKRLQEIAGEPFRSLPRLGPHAGVCDGSAPHVTLEPAPLLDNVEVLLTFVEAILGMPELGLSLNGQPFMGEAFVPVPGVTREDLRWLREVARQYIPVCLMELNAREAQRDTLRTFFERVHCGLDVFATFNYDLVLERALWEAGRLWTPLFGYVGLSAFEFPSGGKEDASIRQRLSRSKCKVLKLHGSVNWQSADQNVDHEPSIMLRSKEQGEPWLLDGFGKVAFSPNAVPQPPGVPDLPSHGYYYKNLLMLPSLIKGVCDEPILAANWRACQKAIQTASQVVAIGYSFPAQDAASRLLLGLIGDRAELLVVGPHADAIADSVKPLVKNVARHRGGFSEWVGAGCPGLKSPKSGKGDPKTYAIIGAGMEVHNELGCGFKEPLCQEAFAVELGKRGIPFEREKSLRVQYKDVLLEKEYSPDFVCFGDIVVEAKALDKLTGKEESQLLNYLKASGLHVGLLLNFGAESFEWKRMVL